MMEAIARKLESAIVETPVMPWPKLHPPALTAPIPIRILPKNTVRDSLAGGIFHLNSLNPFALKRAPRGTAKIKNTPHVPVNIPRKLNSGKGECELLYKSTLKNSRIGVVIARPLGMPPK